MPTIDLKSLLGKAIREKRNAQGISQEELGDRAGLHRTYISDIERGSRNISLGSLDKLARALRIPISTLFSIADSTPSPDDAIAHRTVTTKELVDILLVEDNEQDVTLAIEAFKNVNLSNGIEVVRDGEEALDFIFCRHRYSKRSIGHCPQVILLDLTLPKVSGLEVLRQIKADERTKMIHVIVLTGSQRDHDIAQCRRLGAETCILKPVNLNNLCKVTAKLNLYWALVTGSSSMAA